ncbi:MAG: PHP domain-containing protein [Candidatus Obscuribacterales bacterium]|nr:PHP domain-containing protein [Candidatus Obscuribacterales bacterium]
MNTLADEAAVPSQSSCAGADLHLHSHFSDGTWSPTALVEHAVSKGMRYIALSDHDTVDGLAEAQACLAELARQQSKTLNKSPDFGSAQGSTPSLKPLSEPLSVFLSAPGAALTPELYSGPSSIKSSELPSELPSELSSELGSVTAPSAATLTNSGLARLLPKLINAVEINTVYIDRQGQRQDVHILGYFPDLHSSALHELLERQKAARFRQLEETIALINASLSVSACGLERPGPVRLEDVLAVSGPAAPGKAHLTEALVRLGLAKDLMDAYERFTSSKSPCYAQRRSVNPFEALEALRKAGALTSIAHPGQAAFMQDLLPKLVAAGLDGIEAYHRVHDEQMVRYYENYADAKGLFVTGGSDCHGPYLDKESGTFYPSTMGAIKLPENRLKTFLEKSPIGYCETLSI